MTVYARCVNAIAPQLATGRDSTARPGKDCPLCRRPARRRRFRGAEGSSPETVVPAASPFDTVIAPDSPWRPSVGARCSPIAIGS